MDMLEEAIESPAFYILACGGIIAVVLGWIMAKKSGWVALPIWQLIIILVVIVIASAFFATKD